MEEIFIPASGMAMEEVLLTEWLKEPGEHVEAGDILAVVETDKSTVELSGQSSGTLSRHLVPAGERVRGGTTVAYVLAEGEAEPGTSGVSSTSGTTGSPPAWTTSSSNGSAAPPASAMSSQGGAVAGDKAADGRHLFSPRQRREAILAATQSAAAAGAAEPLAPAPVAATGLASPAPVAGVTAPAPSAATAASGAAAPSTAAPSTAAPRTMAVPAAQVEAAASNRRATAELVSESWRTMPHFSVGREVRTEGLLASLARSRAEGVEATATDFMLRAFAAALEQVGERPDVGLAVATEWGVLIPVVRGVTSRSLPELASLRRAAVDRARLRRLGSADAEPPFATLSNLGPSGVRWFTGVIPLGQVALLTVGRIGPRPAVEGRGLVVAQMFDAVLTADHRRYDGVDSARLLSGFAEHLGGLGGEEER